MAGLAAYGSFRLTSGRQLLEGESNLFRQQARGQLPDLPGPYLEKGNVKDLLFQIADIGIASSASFDPQGNLNIDYYGAKVKTTPGTDWDGTRINQIVIPEMEKMQLTASQSLVPRPAPKEMYTISPILNGSELLKNGKPFYRTPKDGPLDYRDRVFVQDDMMFYSPDLVMNENGGRVFVNSKGTLEKLPAEVGANMKGVGYSEGLGTVCTVSRESESLSERVFLYRDHRWLEVKLPFKTYQHTFVMTPDVLYIYDATKPNGLIYMAGKDGTAKAMAVPPGSNGVSLVSANSRGNAVLKTTYRLPKAKGYEFWGSTHRFELVIDDKLFDLRDLLKANGIMVGDSVVNISTAGASERGDLFVIAQVSDLPHLYLLRRKK